jgi:hypothetical protein
MVTRTRPPARAASKIGAGFVVNHYQQFGEFEDEIYSDCYNSDRWNA